MMLGQIRNKQKKRGVLGEFLIDGTQNQRSFDQKKGHCQLFGRLNQEISGICQEVLWRRIWGMESFNL